jgi:hypothetical protein
MSLFARNAIASVLFAAAFAATAAQTPNAAPAAGARVEMPPLARRAPSYDDIVRAMVYERMTTLEAVVEVEHDAKGNVTSTRWVRRSGRSGVDTAVLQWARRVKLSVDAAGTTQVPVSVVLEKQSERR